MSLIEYLLPKNTYILNYLRDEDVHLPDDKIITRDLLQEAKFYQVQGGVLLEEISSPQQLDSSVIVKNEAEISMSKSWLRPGARFSLLLRASVHGKSPEDFHRCCDNKGATLLVIKTGVYVTGKFEIQVEMISI